MVGLAKLSDVAPMERLQKSGDWPAALIGRTLSPGVPRAALGRPVRLVDGSVARKAGAKKRGGGRLDRAPVVKGEIRVADRAYPQPGGIAQILDDGGDVIIRAGWRNARARREREKDRYNR